MERFLNLRYDGTDVPVMTPCPPDGGDPAKAFENQYRREFGFTLAVCAAILPCPIPEDPTLLAFTRLQKVVSASVELGFDR